MVSLEKRTVETLNNETKKLESRSVLDPCRKIDGKFTTYKPLPTATKSELNKASYEECLARLQCMNTDLSWLLSLPYDRFWCQVIHDVRLHQCLDTFLRYAPRSYDPVDNFDSDDEIRILFPEVSRRIFMTCLRMSTYKETKENHMSPGVFGDIIYENFLFDLPLLMDLCVLYGRSNRSLLSKMVKNVFSTQPKYNHDLHSGLVSILQVFDTIAAQCDVTDDIASLPPKLSHAQLGSLGSQPDNIVLDLVDYCYDVAQSLFNFLEVYTEGAHAFFQQNLHTKISWFYSNVVPVLKESILSREFSAITSRRDVIKRLNQCRHLLVKIVRKVLYTTCIQAVLENSDSIDESENPIETYLQNITDMLSDRKFMCDYEAKFHFADDLDIIGQTNYKIDETRIVYIREALTMPSSDKVKRTRRNRDGIKFTGSVEHKKKKSVKWRCDAPSDIAKQDVMSSASAQTSAMNYMNTGADECGAIGGASGVYGDDYGAMSAGAAADYGGASNSGTQGALEDFGACAPSVTGVELDSLISSVHDILPDIGAGFIQACLEEYNFSESAVIDAILSDHLRPNVRNMDRNKPRTPPPDKTPTSGTQTTSGKGQSQSLLKDRANVYDGDEFDVFTHDKIDLTRVTRGKKFTGDENMSLLDDRFELNKNMYDKFSVIDQHGDAYDPEKDQYESALYDDEYDDTYDTADVGAMLDADEIEDFKIEPLNQKKGRGQRYYTRDDDEDEDESETPIRRVRGEFCTDPSQLREQNEMRRSSQQQRKAQGGPPKTHDVKGKTKGQGQEESVLKNRNYKDKNKARISNHNRRAGADHKRNKGMIPS